MKMNTAVGIVLVGVGASLRYPEGARRLLRDKLSAAAAFVALAIGIATLAEYVLSIDLRIDNLFVTDSVGPYPGRPSPPTALALSLLALALLVFDVRRAARARPSEWLAMSAGFVAFAALLGSAFGAAPLYRLPSAPVIGVAIPTAVGLLLISVGMLFQRPSAGVMRLFVSSGPGGTLLRRFVPAAILAPILVKAVITWLLAALGIFDMSLISAVLIGSMGVLGLVLLSVTAPRLNRAHESLAASRTRISELLEQAPDGIFVADQEGRYREVNGAGCRMLGYRREEILGKNIVDFIPAEDVDRLWRARQQLLEGGVQVAEWTLRCRDGTPLPVEVSAAILTDRRWQAIVRDISERKRAEARLREAQERLELALRGADLAVWDWNVQSGEVVFSPRWAEMRGFRPDEIEPRVESWVSGIHPEDWPRVQQALDDYFQGRVPEYESEFRVRVKSGDWIWILDRGRVFARDERGRPTRMVGTELDVTPRKQAEARRRLAEATFSGILSISADAIISIDDDQRITLFNEGAEKIFGHSRAEVLGAPFEILLPERFRVIHRAHVEKFAAGEQVARRMGGRDVPIFGLRKNGQEFPADAAISKFEVDAKSVLTVTLRDITVQKRLETDLRRALQSRDEVLGIVAHDLRNPVGTLILQASLLRRGGSEADPRSRKAAEAIERAANRMNHLIQDLLDVTQIEGGRLSIERGRLPAGQVVSEALESQKELASSASLDLQVDLAQDLPDVWADRDRLLQIFENLIGNALKFTGAGGRITVGAAPRDSEVLFWVADTGSGINAENLPHLFDRFWQARHARGSGAGLGLPIVKGIVEAHGGRIWVTSTVGRGSTFFFTIPAASPADARYSEPLPHGSQSLGSQGIVGTKR